jgi:tetratricopeptide (TPR) repeat protein/TolB-like protein
MVVVAAGSMYLSPRGRSAPLPHIKNVAVLPFRVIEHSPDKRMTAYAEGVSLYLTRRLMELTTVDLHIMPPTTVRDAIIDSSDKARAEGANLVVQGAFTFSDDVATFEYYLSRTTDDRTLRSGTVKGSISSLVTLKDDIVREVSWQLETEVGPKSEVGDQKAIALYTEGLGFLWNYHEPQNLNAAIELFNQAVKIDPNYAEAYAALGQAYWYKYKDGASSELAILEKSKDACQQAIRLDSRNSDAFVCLGRVHQQDDRKLAIEEYKLAIKYSASNDDAFVSLGSALEEEGRFDEAEREYLWSVKLRPQYWATHSWIAGFYCDRRKYVEALEHYEMALNLSPDNARLLTSTACALSNLGLFDEAERNLKKAISLRPWAPPHSNLGMVYLQWGKHKYADAARELEMAFSQEEPDGLNVNYRITGNLARIYKLMDQEQKAREKYELAIEQGRELLEKPDHRAHILLGNYNAMLGNKREANSLFNIAFALHPNDPHYLLIAANAYVELGEPDIALFYVEQAIKAGYTDVQILAEPELQALQTKPRYIELISSLRQGR